VKSSESKSRNKINADINTHRNEKNLKNQGKSFLQNLERNNGGQGGSQEE
jgi:hypothetical protein